MDVAPFGYLGARWHRRCAGAVSDDSVDCRRGNAAPKGDADHLVPVFAASSFAAERRRFRCLRWPAARRNSDMMRDLVSYFFLFPFD